MKLLVGFLYFVALVFFLAGLLCIICEAANALPQIIGGAILLIAFLLACLISYLEDKYFYELHIK